MKHTAIFSLFFFYNCNFVYLNSLKIGRQVENFNDGNREKTIFHLDSRFHKDNLNHPLRPVMRRFRRYIKDSGVYSPKNTTVSIIF